MKCIALWGIALHFSEMHSFVLCLEALCIANEEGKSVGFHRHHAFISKTSLKTLLFFFFFLFFFFLSAFCRFLLFFLFVTFL